MPFHPNSSLFSKSNARNINHMSALIFFKMVRLERKMLFSDNLPGNYFREWISLVLSLSVETIAPFIIMSPALHA